MPSRISIANKEDWGDQPAFFDTSVEIFRYLVVIAPSQELVEKIARLKERVATVIGTFRGLHSIAHMTLLYAYLPVEYERVLCAGIVASITDHRAFDAHFEGIKHYPDKRTIYLDLIEKKPVIALRKSIRDRLRSEKRLKNLGIHATTDPRLSIATHLDQARFDQAWNALAPHEFRHPEIIDQVILLRGALREGERYVVVERFRLKVDS